MVDVAPSGRPIAVLRAWSLRQWSVAAAGAVATALAMGLPTDVIPNPVFDRPVPVTWWSIPALAVASILAGLLLATYVRDSAATPERLDRPGRIGGVGGVLTFFAVGCPVCNKLVVVAIGTTGAMELFAPLQQVLAIASVVLLALALRGRLRGALSCPLPAS